MTKRSKDTRLANDSCGFDISDRLRIGVENRDHSAHQGDLPTFCHFLDPFAQNPGKSPMVLRSPSRCERAAQDLKGGLRHFQEGLGYS